MYFCDCIVIVVTVFLFIVFVCGEPCVDCFLLIFEQFFSEYFQVRLIVFFTLGNHSIQCINDTSDEVKNSS